MDALALGLAFHLFYWVLVLFDLTLRVHTLLHLFLGGISTIDGGPACMAIGWLALFVCVEGGHGE